MNLETIQIKMDYEWQKEAMLNSDEYPQAICITGSNEVFSVAYTPPVTPDGKSSGYLQKWSDTQKKWLKIAGKVFSNIINDMCCDNLGNIYLVGDKNELGNYVISIYNTSTGWTEADNGYKYVINYICCAIDNSIYISGNFQDATGHCTVVKYTISNNLWTTLDGSTFTSPITGLCIDINENLYALETVTTSTESSTSINHWNGMAWDSINSLDINSATAITCDNLGNIYFNSNSTIWSYNLTSQVYTDLNLTIPSFKGTVVSTNLLSVDGVLYFSISGYTATYSMEFYLYVYENKIWTDITPSNNMAIVYQIACSRGTSTDIFLASNLNYVYVGKPKNLIMKTLRQLATAVESRPSGTPGPNDVFYSATDYNVTIPISTKFILSSNGNGTGATFVDDLAIITVKSGSDSTVIFKKDYSHDNSGAIHPIPPFDLTSALTDFVGENVAIQITFTDLFPNAQGGSNFFLCYE